MRFPVAALFFLVSSFIFFIAWAVSNFLLTNIVDAMEPYATDLGEASFTNMLTLLPTAFGIMCALFFITGIILIFVMDSLADEPEMFYRER